MIKINLLPEIKRKVVKKKQKVSREIPFAWIAAAIVAIVLTIMGLGFWHFQLIKKQNALQDDIARIESEINKKKVLQAEVEKARVQRNALAQKLEIIATLKKRKTGPVQLLDQLAGAMPRRVWLSEMNETGNAMTVTGFALDHSQIAQFMENLGKSNFFTGIELITASSGEGAKKKSAPSSPDGGPIPTKQFEITCKVNYSANR